MRAMTSEERAAQVRRVAARIFGGTPAPHEDGDPLLDEASAFEDPYTAARRAGEVDPHDSAA